MPATAVVLQFEGRRLHAFRRPGSDLLWFVLADVCAILGIVNPTRTAMRLPKHQKGAHTMSTPGGQQRVTIVSESGVYDLATTSRKPIAQKFKRWLFEEVLPEIRRTGSYHGDTTPLDALISELQPALDLTPPPRTNNVVPLKREPTPEEKQAECERRERVREENARAKRARDAAQPPLDLGDNDKALDELGRAAERVKSWQATADGVTYNHDLCLRVSDGSPVYLHIIAAGSEPVAGNMFSIPSPDGGQTFALWVSASAPRSLVYAAF